MEINLYPTNFKTSLESRLRAAAGIPAYMRRKRRIEDLEDAARSALALAYEQALMDNGGDVRGARAAMIQSARRLDLRLLNDLIDRHNRYYPIEANLPSDVQTGCLLVGGKPWEPLPSVTWETLLEAGTSGAS